MKIFWIKSIHFSKLIYQLIISAPFLTLTLYGNVIVLIFSCLFYFVEVNANEKIVSFIDAVWWAFTTVTTVGYGDIVPVTFLGKVVGITLMLIGMGLFGIYTALFARAILDDEIYMQ